MSQTAIRGTQIIDGTIESIDIEDGGIWREDLNTTSTGKATITQVAAGSGISIESTGVDPGTGLVTISLNSSTGGITTTQHRLLDQLVHAIVETNYYEISRAQGKITSEIWWTSSGKTRKVREIDYTYSGNNISSTITKQYDSLGSVVETYTETYNRTGNTITSIDGVLT